MAGWLESADAAKKTSWLDSSGGGGERKKSWASSLGDDVLAAIKSNPEVQGGVALGRGIIDLLSRGMYATAGAADEIKNPSSSASLPARMGARALREIFSGLPGVQGDKREFTEVMERAGMPELGHLHDVLPQLPVYTGGGMSLIPTAGTAIDATGRGAIGLAANIALDPTTYITSGGSVIGRHAMEDGILNLSKKGLAAKDAIVSDLAPTYRLLAETDDAVLRETGRRQVRQVLDTRLKAAVAEDPSLLEKTGLKFGGFEVVSPRTVQNLTEPVKRMVLSAPGGAKAARAAEAFGDGMRRLFDPYAELAKLDDTAKEGVANKVREYQNAMAANLTREAAQYEDIASEEARLARKYGKGDAGIQALGKKFADWREGTGTPDLTKAEEDFFQRVAANYDARGEVNVRNGVISGDQYDKYQGSFLHHSYKNPEVLSETVKAGRETGLIPPTKINRERDFDTLAEAVDVSRGLRRIGLANRERGGARAVYGELVPEYGISKNLMAHAEQSNRAIWQKKLFDDVRDTYGLSTEAFDPSRVWKLNEAIPSVAKDTQAIEAFRDGTATLNDLGDSFAYGWRTAKTPELMRANRELNEAVQNVPRKASERRTIRADEIAYYKRHGWDVISPQSDDVPGAAFSAQQRAISRLPEARRAYEQALKDAPLDYVDRQTLKHPDESAYFRRRGADLVEEDGKIVAYTLKEASGAKQQAWRNQIQRLGDNVRSLQDQVNELPSRLMAYRVTGGGAQEQIGYVATLKRAQARFQAAQERAFREVRNLDAEGHAVDGLAAAMDEAKKILPTLTPDGRMELGRQLLSMTRSESQALRVINTLGEHNVPDMNAVRPGDIENFFTRHGLPEDKARLVPVSGGIWGDQEHLIPAAIAKMVEDAPRDIVMSAANRAKVGFIVKGYDRVNNLFKGITYPFWPAGAVRDAYNNLQQGFLALGIGGLTRPRVAANILGGSAEPIELGALRMTGAEWKNLSEDLRVVDPSASGFVQMTGQGAERPGVYAKARAIRGNVDNFTRTQLWANGIRMGMSPEDSARMVHEFLFNYSELSSFDRDVMRRAIPFYVFPRKAIGNIGEQIVKQPGRVINLAKPFLGRDSENQAMTTWEGEGFKVRLDRNGKNVTMLNGVDLPIRSFDMLWRGGFRKTLEGLVGSASPAIKIPYMAAADRDPFRGQPFGRLDAPTLGRAMENWPKPIKDWAGWRKDTDSAGRPRYTVNEEKVRIGIEASMLSRFFSTGDRYFREQLKDPSTANFWLQSLTGIQKKSLNLDDEQKRKLDAAIRDAEAAAVKQGTLRESRRVYEPRGR